MFGCLYGMADPEKSGLFHARVGNPGRNCEGEFATGSLSPRRSGAIVRAQALYSGGVRPTFALPISGIGDTTLEHINMTEIMTKLI